MIMAELPDTISIAAAGELLGLTPERVRQLIKAGYVPTAGRGRTTLKGAVSGYIAFVREDRRAARSRARAAADWRGAVNDLATRLG